MPPRARQRHHFLVAHHWQHAAIEPLVPDASFRQYFRLHQPPHRAMLMDAPPAYEDVARFVTVTDYLSQAGIRVAAILARDLPNGFLLLEDLGDATFTRLLERGQPPQPLYRQALQAMLQMQQRSVAPPLAAQLQLPAYDRSVWLPETLLFVDWYLAACRAQPLPPTARHQFIRRWQQLDAELPSLPPVLVHRDFHVDNLMLHQHQCALLDYQDALMGSPTYDLVSLLEDARRDLVPSLRQELLEAFYAHYAHLDTAALNQHCAFWSAQRHCKVAGIFVRLWLRDAKPAYLHHLPRVLRLLNHSIQHPTLAALRHWLEEQLGRVEHDPKSLVGF